MTGGSVLGDSVTVAAGTRSTVGACRSRSEPMKALVTGGAGFIGSTLVDRLLAEGHHVDVIDDLSSGSLANLADARAGGAGRRSFHQLDLVDDAVIDVVARRQPDVVFHLAGDPDPQVASSSRRGTQTTTIVGTLHLLEGARAGGVDKVVFASSCDIYGEVVAADLPVRESHPQRPRSPHGVAKKAVTDYLAAYREIHDLEFTSLALASVYGPRQDPRRGHGVVASFASRCWPTNRRDPR